MKTTQQDGSGLIRLAGGVLFIAGLVTGYYFWREAGLFSFPTIFSLFPILLGIWTMFFMHKPSPENNQASTRSPNGG